MNDDRRRTTPREYIKTKYDVETARLTRKYEGNLHKLAWHKNHLIFNIRCKKAKVLPQSLWIQSLVRTKNGYCIAKKTGWLFLRERICTPPEDTACGTATSVNVLRVVKQVCALGTAFSVCVPCITTLPSSLSLPPSLSPFSSRTQTQLKAPLLDGCVQPSASHSSLPSQT